MRKALFPSIAFLGLLALGACAKRDINVTDGWVRLSTVPNSPSAAYFTIKGGSDPDKLIAVGSQVAIRVEMHETLKDGGMMKMRALDAVDIPAGETVKFEPGGKHVMMWNVNPGIKPGGKMTMTFTFASGAQFEYPMAVQGPADAAPTAGAN